MYKHTLEPDSGHAMHEKKKKEPKHHHHHIIPNYEKLKWRMKIAKLNEKYTHIYI